MEHKKTFYAIEFNTPQGTIVVEGPVSPENLASHEFHHDLSAFRLGPKQHKALIEISKLPEGRILIARQQNMIIGYATYLYPDPLERWSEGNMDNLIELGAIEVIDQFRGCHVGKNILKVSMMDDAMEDYIIFTTAYYWHWDLKRTELSVWEYKKLLEKMMNAGGLEWYATDDPEICSHPANFLMARIGKRVTPDSILQFDQLRFKNNYLY